MGKNALNATEMKIRNKRLLLEKLRVNACSRAELSRETGLTRAAISIMIDNLLEEQLVIEGTPILGKVGRKSYRIQLNPRKYYIVGIHLGRKLSSVGIADFSGHIKKVETIDDESESLTVEQILSHMKKMIQAYGKEYGQYSELLGIGITAPGPLDIENGKILNPPNFKRWANVSVCGYFEKEFHVPVILENDINAAAMAEQYFGIGMMYRNYLELNLDTGVGGGIVMEGKLYRGGFGMGNQVGHITIDINGETCMCGNMGCIELYASLPNIVKYARRQDALFYTWRRIVDLAEEGNEKASLILNKEAKYLSTMIVSVMNILDLDAVIMNGEISYKGDLINKRLESEINAHFIGRNIHTIPVLVSKMPANNHITPSINLIVDHYIRGISTFN